MFLGVVEHALGRGAHFLLDQLLRLVVDAHLGGQRNRCQKPCGVTVCTCKDRLVFTSGSSSNAFGRDHTGCSLLCRWSDLITQRFIPHEQFVGEESCVCAGGYTGGRGGGGLKFQNFPACPQALSARGTGASPKETRGVWGRGGEVPCVLLKLAPALPNNEAESLWAGQNFPGPIPYECLHVPLAFRGP